MILIGNQRGGAKNLAQHLLKEENDHVQVHDIRGFVSNDLNEAMTEAYAVSRGTRCKQFLFSLSLNPPKDAEVSTETFESAINRVETKLGLEGQPRAIVFHEKEGRRHAHAVWSLINVEEMKAVQMSYSGEKLMDVSRDLHREHGWKMPKGLVERSERDPRNFTLEEWQQAKRNGVDPRDIKTHIQDAWAMSDSKAALSYALEERGYRLAKGDRRSFVAIDYRGEVYSIPKMAGVKTKEVRQRLGDAADLSTVEEAKTAWASDMLKKAQDLQRKLDQKREAERRVLEDKRADLVAKQKQERADQQVAQQKRQTAEAKTRQERFRSGIKGLWDRLRGEYRRIVQKNLQEGLNAQKRDQEERDKLAFLHLQQRREIVKTNAKAREQYRETSAELETDRETFSRAAKGAFQAAPTEIKKPRPSRAPPKVEKAIQSAPNLDQTHQVIQRKDLKTKWKAVAPAAPPSPVLSEKEKRREAFKQQRREGTETQAQSQRRTLDR